MKSFSVYDPIFSNEELEIYTPSDIHRIIYNTINALELGVEPHSNPLTFIGNVEYRIVYLTLNNTDLGTLTDISILYRTISRNVNYDEPWKKKVDLIEFIIIENPNIYDVNESIVTTTTIDLNGEVEETEEEYKKRERKEAILFGDKLLNFKLYKKDLFFNDTFPRLIKNIVAKYKYRKDS